MRPFLLRIALFAVPFAALSVIELFVLPMDFFTFRSWEALRMTGPPSLWSGPFYPDRSLRRKEFGDLGHHSPYAVAKDVFWKTDRFGYRNRFGLAKPDVVIVGYSNVVGPGLSQDDTLAESLRQRIGLSVYPYSPWGAYDYLADPRFRRSPPGIVILATMERDCKNWNSDEPRDRGRWTSVKRSVKGWGQRMFAESAVAREVSVLVSRLHKQVFWNFLRARARGALEAALSRMFGTPLRWRFAVGSDGATLFFEGKSAWLEPSLEELKALVARIQGVRRRVEARGGRFLFVPMPDKETLYYDLVPGAPPSQPAYFRRLLAELKKAGVPTVDLLTPFEKSRAADRGVLYLMDDSHWSPEGVQLAVGEIAAALDGL